MRANASKRRQKRTNASKRRGENASKRKQTRANVDKRKQTLTPPFIAVFLHPPLQSAYCSLNLEQIWKGGVEVPILFFMGVGIFPIYETCSKVCDLKHPFGNHPVVRASENGFPRRQALRSKNAAFCVWFVLGGNQSIYLHRSGPRLENGLDSCRSFKGQHD